MAILKDAEASHLLKAVQKSVDLMLENQMQMKLDLAKELKETKEKLDKIIAWLPGLGNSR